MEFARNVVDDGYKAITPFLFKANEKDPEKAHEMFVRFSKFADEYGFDKFLLDNRNNQLPLPFELSNAAGFNKNGEIPPSFLSYLGFNRVVVGTVTNEEWSGNERPRIKRYPKTKSIVNWMGLPGLGSKKVAENINSYDTQGIPITTNIMSTPGKIGDEMQEDLQNTVADTRHFTDRYELNISCPNTHSSSGAMDARNEFQRSLESMLRGINESKSFSQGLHLKVSPDIDEVGVRDVLEVAKENYVGGITVANTTTSHNPAFIPENLSQGGASGKAVKDNTTKTLYNFKKEIRKNGYNLHLTACGGIDSVEEVEKKLYKEGANGIQMYTPLIFEGPKLVRDIRRHFI